MFSHASLFDGTLHNKKMSNFKNKKNMKTRIYFLDNLRTFMIFLVVLLHAGLVYESVLENTWIVCDPVKNNSIGLVRMYLDVFVMFSLFFISGYFIPYSVKSKNAWGFLKSKFKRIMLPWIIAVLTLIPAYKAIFLYSRGLPREEWFSYFHFFQRAGGNLGFFADNPTQNWLWFLPVLFLFQILYLVLSKTNLLSIKISLKTGVILTFVIGLIYSMIISSMNLKGWFHSPILHFQRERLPVYFMVFLLGSLCYKLKIFKSNNKNKRYYILSNVVLALSLSVFTAVALNLFFNIVNPERNYFFVSETIDRIFYYSSLLLSMLCFLQILIHTFRFHFNKTSNLLNQLSKNSYYVYIIHVIVVGLIALILLNISIPAIVKYLILAIFTYIFSNFIVYGYRGIFHRIISMKSVIATILVIILVTFAFNGKKKNIATGDQQPTTSDTTTILPGKGLHEAALTGDIEAIRQHIKIGSDLNEKEPRGGSSPMPLSYYALIFSSLQTLV